MDKLVIQFVLFFAISIMLSQTAISADVNSSASNNKVSTNKVSKAAPLIIQSQVKGSQEQPNVIYIMPWQGVDQVIEVKGKARTIKLPNFQPINPRAFKEQVRFFANKKLATQSAGTKTSSGN